MFRVEFTAKALKTFKKFDKQTSLLLMAWIRKNLEGCTNPRLYGKALTGDKNGQWRYRIGDYRLLAEILDDKIVILVLNVGHRKDIYNQ